MLDPDVEGGSDASENNSNSGKMSQEPQEALRHPEVIVDYPSNDEPEDCIAYDGETRLANGDIMLARTFFLRYSHLTTGVDSSGDWNILLYKSKGTADAYCPMISFHAEAPTEEQPSQFRMSGFSYTRLPFTCTGTLSKTENAAIFGVQLHYWVNDWPDNIKYLSGKLDILEGSITGTWGDKEDVSKHTGVFVLKRTPGHILRFRPALSILSENKPKALWDYAIRASLHLVRKRRWSWSFFKERREIRRRYIDLAMRDDGFGHPCSPEEKKELAKAVQLLSATDARFYHLLRILKERPLMTE